MRFIQHKAEARWFYRVVSLGYDRWINPLFWTAPMRDEALALARLDDPGLEVVDVGAGTGFATEAIVRTVAPERVTMLDQSPHQLARARRKRALAGVAKVIGDAEALPFATDSRDRYVSTGQHRVLARSAARHRRGLPRPAPRRRRAAGRPAAAHAPAGARAVGRVDALPRRGRVRRVVRARGLRVDRARARRPRLVGPALGPLRAWRSPPSSRGPASRRALAPAAAAAEERRAVTLPVRLARFAAGSLAGAAFIPVALWFTLVRKLRRVRLAHSRSSRA